MKATVVKVVALVLCATPVFAQRTVVVDPVTKEVAKVTETATGETPEDAATRKKADPRMATMRKVHLVAIDDLGYDVTVVDCLAEILPRQFPTFTVVPREEAEVILRIRANIPSATSRVVLGVLGGSPSAHMYAELPDGTKLWNDGAKYRRAMMRQGQFGSTGGDTGKAIECGLAQGLVETLRNSLRALRDKK